MEDLVLAVPSHVVAGLSRGYATAMSMELLDALWQESWMAVPSAINADVDATAVDLLVLFRRAGSHWWVTADGRLGIPAPVGIEDMARGEGLSALRATAQVRSGCRRVELAGAVTDLPRLGRRLILVYVAEAQGDPVGGGAWVSQAAAARMPLDPLSTLIASTWS